MTTTTQHLASVLSEGATRNMQEREACPTSFSSSNELNKGNVDLVYRVLIAIPTCRVHLDWLGKSSSHACFWPPPVPRSERALACFFSLLPRFLTQHLGSVVLQARFFLASAFSARKHGGYLAPAAEGQGHNLRLARRKCCHGVLRGQLLSPQLFPARQPCPELFGTLL